MVRNRISSRLQLGVLGSNRGQILAATLKI